MSSIKRALMKSALRQSRRTSDWMGYWLHRERRREKLKVPEQARRLGITVSQLVSLSLCMPPRKDHFQEDLQAICQACPMNLGLLANLIRKEWTLFEINQPTRPHTSEAGWLMAASETPPTDQPESHEPT
jgi:hypothetical protein